jgi:hypothetical protein
MELDGGSAYEREHRNFNPEGEIWCSAITSREVEASWARKNGRGKKINRSVLLARVVPADQSICHEVPINPGKA